MPNTLPPRPTPVIRIVARRTARACGATLLSLSVITAGCASNKSAKNELAAGYQSLDQHKYDQAIQQADAFLAKNPTGAGSAEALYLRGRAFEQKQAANPHESKTNLQAARSSYVEALNRRPNTQLETHIRTSLANVAYFQDDYATALAQFNAALPRLAEFILPAGTRAASLAHVCRTVARRAERAVVALGAAAELNDALRQYLNRLSDLLFVLARVLNRMDGGDDVYWKSERMARAAAADATDANDEEGSPS